MQNTRIVAGGVLFAAMIGASHGGGADAMTMKECSVKYHAAKTAGTLAGADWKSFRATQCASGTAAMPNMSATPATPAASAATTASAATAAKPMAAAPAPATSGTATFPNAVDPKYSSLTAGKARMHTCVDQYKVNKTANANGGLRWIQKGGGYYSECNKKLKG